MEKFKIKDRIRVNSKTYECIYCYEKDAEKNAVFARIIFYGTVDKDGYVIRKHSLLKYKFDLHDAIILHQNKRNNIYYLRIKK